MASKTDNLYSQPLFSVPEFRFDEQVAAVFPDMIQRSVPGYQHLVALLGLLAGRYAQDGSKIYDLGCSLGAATLSMVQGTKAEDCEFIAVDNSSAMIERCFKNFSTLDTPHSIDWVCEDIVQLLFEPASIVVLNFTLQFVSPEERLGLLRRIHKNLLPGGVLVISEKLAFAADDVQQELTELHHDFKRVNGYSDLEISQKRSAIENVLISDTLEEHMLRLQTAGFERSTVWYQCLNFASILAWK